jgi:hypothetical protein
MTENNSAPVPGRAGGPADPSPSVSALTGAHPSREPRRRRKSTWGDTYDAALRRGYDHGYAAFAADRQEARRHG